MPPSLYVDVIVLSTLLRKLDERGMGEDKMRKLRDVQRRREGEREAARKGDGRYEGML